MSSSRFYMRYRDPDQFGNRETIDLFIDRDGEPTTDRPHLHLILYRDGICKVVATLSDGSHPFEQMTDLQNVEAVIAEANSYLPLITDRLKERIYRVLEEFILPTGESFRDLCDGIGECRDGVYAMLHDSARLCHNKYYEFYQEINQQLRAVGAHAHWNKEYYQTNFNNECPFHGAEFRRAKEEHKQRQVNRFRARAAEIRDEATVLIHDEFHMTDHPQFESGGARLDLLSAHFGNEYEFELRDVSISSEGSTRTFHYRLVVKRFPFELEPFHFDHT